MEKEIYNLLLKAFESLTISSNLWLRTYSKGELINNSFTWWIEAERAESEAQAIITSYKYANRKEII